MNIPITIPGIRLPMQLTKIAFGNGLSKYLFPHFLRECRGVLTRFWLFGLIPYVCRVNFLGLAAAKHKLYDNI